ncbi:hypothetical protein ACFL47_00125 [Candidatus Latescibacterota bacterium]
MNNCLIQKKMYIAAFLLLVIFAIGIHAQPTALNGPTGTSILRVPAIPKLNLRNISLLNPERFQMKHQYVMNFSSVGGNGSMLGMYLNTMEYKFNIPLTMRLQVAYQTQSAQLFGRKNSYSGQQSMNGGNVFIPSFDIEYRLTKNTVIGLHYRDYSSMNPYSNPYSRYNGYGNHRYSPFMRY